MTEIKIYGEIAPAPAEQWARECGYYSLAMLQQDLDNIEGDVHFRINSIGGDVTEGFAMYSEIRRFAKKHSARVKTSIDAQCASIATILFLSGDDRVINPYLEPFVHNAYVYTQGDGKSLKRTAALVDHTNEKIAGFYEDHTNLTKDEALELMQLSTHITTEEAIRMRFGTEIEDLQRPAALARFNETNTKAKNKKMAKPKQKKEKPENDLNQIVNKLRAIFSPATVKNLMLYSTAKEEIDFSGVETSADIVEGTEVTVDGDATVSGTYTIDEVGEVEIENGKVKTITVEDEDEDEEIKNLKAENAQKDAEIDRLKNKMQEQSKQMGILNKKIEDGQAVLNKLQGVDPSIDPAKPKTPPQTPRVSNKKQKEEDILNAITNIKI